MGNWAHARICNFHTVTRPTERLLTTKPQNISNCADIVPTSGICFLRQCLNYRRG